MACLFVRFFDYYFRQQYVTREPGQSTDRFQPRLSTCSLAQSLCLHTHFQSVWRRLLELQRLPETDVLESYGMVVPMPAYLSPR